MKRLSILMTMAVALSATAAPKESRIPATETELILKCDTPTGFTGLSAKLEGTLKLSSLPNGAMKATGPVQMALLNPRNVWKGKKTVLGQYDDLSSVGNDRYFHGGAQIKGDNDLMSIYVNFTRPEMSYVEYGGENYKTACK